QSARAINQLDRANIFFQYLLDRTPPHPGASYRDGLIYGEYKNYSLPVSAARNRVQELPELKGAFAVCVRTCAAMAAPAEAELFLVSLQKSRPDSPSAHYGVGYYYYDNNNYEAAIGAFDAAISLNPQFVDAHYFRAYAYLSGGRYAESLEAIRTCQEALEAS